MFYAGLLAEQVSKSHTAFAIIAKGGTNRECSLERLFGFAAIAADAAETATMNNYHTEMKI